MSIIINNPSLSWKKSLNFYTERVSYNYLHLINVFLNPLETDNCCDNIYTILSGRNVVSFVLNAY